MTFVCNGRVYDALDNKNPYELLLARTVDRQFDRQYRRRAVTSFLACILHNPDIVLKGAGWLDEE